MIDFVWGESVCETDSNYNFKLTKYQTSNLENKNCYYIADKADIAKKIDFNYKYFINTHKIYKIWFNSDPDTFLTDINKERLKELRHNNQHAQISFLYSSGRLSNRAKTEMDGFLSTLCVESVDADKIIMKAINNVDVDNNERKILLLAKEELDNFKKGNHGGNPAAASDLLRISRTIAEKLGIYSDFDINLKFDDKSVFFKVTAPVIMRTINNDFFAFSCANSSNTMHHDAVEILSKIQEEIISRYECLSRYLLNKTCIIDSYNLNYKFQLYTKYLATTPNKDHDYSLTYLRSTVSELDLNGFFEFIYFHKSNILEDSEMLNFDFEKKSQKETPLGSINNSGPEKTIDLFFYLLKYPRSLGYYLVFMSWHSPKICEYFLEQISQSSDSYGANDVDVKLELKKFKDSNFENQMKLFNSIVSIVYGKQKDSFYIPKDSEEDNLISLDLKNKYKNLIVSALFDYEKFQIYKNSVMYFSGPEILVKLFGDSRKRSFYSPEENNMSDSLLRDRLDGSWYLHNL